MKNKMLHRLRVHNSNESQTAPRLSRHKSAYGRFYDMYVKVHENVRYTLRLFHTCKYFFTFLYIFHKKPSAVWSLSRCLASLWQIISRPASTSATLSASARSHCTPWNYCTTTTHWDTSTRPSSSPSCCMHHRLGGVSPTRPINNTSWSICATCYLYAADDPFLGAFYNISYTINITDCAESGRSGLLDFW